VIVALLLLNFMREPTEEELLQLLVEVGCEREGQRLSGNGGRRRADSLALARRTTALRHCGQLS
jgi:hypothetical protein